LGQGKCVKNFTARAGDVNQIAKVQAWLVTHGLTKLEVTNVKDPLCAAIWDDKAVGVTINSGMRKAMLLLKGHKLHYKTTYQGLLIYIENRVGSIRRWKDSEQKKGSFLIFKGPRLPAFPCTGK